MRGSGSRSVAYPGIHLSRLLELLLATCAAGAARAGDTAEADEGGSGGDQELLVHVGERWRGFHNVLIARTGYSGEDGFEVYIPRDEEHHREDVERADGGRRGVWHSALRTGRAQHAAAGGRHEPLRA